MRLKGYRRLWWATLVSISVPAGTLTLLERPVPALVIIVTTVGLCIGAVLTPAHVALGRWLDPAAAAVLLISAAPVLGDSVVPLTLLATMTSVPVLRGVLIVHEGLLDQTDNDTPYDCPRDAGRCFGAMSGAELCHLWCHSFRVVKSGTEVSRRVVSAAIRGTILDELERRDAARFAEWLARHPAPASQPTWAASQKPRTGP